MELNLDNLMVSVPLRRDEGGAIRIGQGRLLMYIVIDDYNMGLHRKRLSSIMTRSN